MLCVLCTYLNCAKSNNSLTPLIDGNLSAISSECLEFVATNSPNYVWPALPQKKRVSALKILRNNGNCNSLEEEKTLKLSYPKSVAADGKGQIYVVDKAGVLVVDESLQTISRFADTGPNKMKAPLGLDISREGDLYIVDGQRKSVFVYSAQNQFLREIGAGDFMEPAGIVLDNENEWVYVSDKKANTIRKYTLSGEFLSLISSSGPGTPGELSFPLQLALNSKGDILALHLGTNVVNVYNKSGQYLFAFGLHYLGNEFSYYLLRPKGIAVDSEDNVYIADSTLDKLQIYSPQGKLRMILGGAGSKPGNFSLPMMIDIDSQNRIYVAEYGGERIQIFQFHISNDDSDD